jgi:hypothetical protein
MPISDNWLSINYIYANINGRIPLQLKEYYFKLPSIYEKSEVNGTILPFTSGAVVTKESYN